MVDNVIGLIVEVDFLAWQHHDGALLGAAHTLGDSDGDGDVDAEDLVAFRLAFGPPPVFSGIVSVPEPGTIGLAGLLEAGLWIWCWRLRVHRQPVG